MGSEMCIRDRFASGQVFKSVGGKLVRPHMYDGNYVVASNHPKPWLKQLNMLAGYAYFYNPVWFIVNLFRVKRSRLSHKPAGMQLVGMAGLVMTVFRTSGWIFRLMVGRIERFSEAPRSQLPFRAVGGEMASHDTPKVTVQINRSLVELQVRAKPRETAETAGV